MECMKTSKKKYNHSSKKLDEYLGQYVVIEFFDRDLKSGTLYKSKERRGPMIYYLQLHNNPYIDKVYFSKSHVKKIDKFKEEN